MSARSFTAISLGLRNFGGLGFWCCWVSWGLGGFRAWNLGFRDLGLRFGIQGSGQLVMFGFGVAG